MKITSGQIDGIRTLITKGGITTATLQDDVLDHLCCVIEYKMKLGNSYDTALAAALEELAPDGLDEIQHETHFLLNSKRILFMKTITYILGLLFTMAFLTGWLFGFLHLPGAMELSVGGFTGFALIFVPLLAFDYFKVRIQRAMSEKAMVWAGAASVITIGVSGIFKILHLAGASWVLFIGSVSFIAIFLPLLFFKLYRRSVANG
jgi:hypothetical protein